MVDRLTIALAQMMVVKGAAEANFQRAVNSVADSARQGADIVLLPELWACGYAVERFPECADALDKGMFARMKALAMAYRVAVGGSHLERTAGGIYNTFALYGPEGRRWGVYRKIHRFLPMGEGALEAGKAAGLAATPWGKAGMAVCYDLRFPEVFRVQMEGGARLLLIVAAWPASRIEHWRLLLQARAVENQAFVVGVNRADGGTRFGGQSMVVSPTGEVLAQAGRMPVSLLASIDLGEADAYRADFPVLQHRRPQAYRLEGNT